MIKKMLKIYYKILSQSFFKFLYGKVLISKSTSNLIKKIKISNSIFKTYNNQFYYLYIIKDARIFTDNNENVAIIKNNILISNVSFQQINGRLRKAKYNSVLQKGTTSIVKKIEGRVFNLCQGGSGNNYFHFLFDIVAKIHLIKAKIDLREIDFFYLAEPKKYQLQILKFFGINKNKLISSKRYKHIFADEILTVDHPWYESGFIQPNIKKIPSWVIHENKKIFLPKSKIKTKAKIFLDRSQSKYNHCQISNFKVLQNLLEKKKIKVYQPEKLSFKKQINLLRKTNLVIGAHGAAFANIIFCKPKTKIIEIIPSNHPNRQSERICKILNLKYFRIQTKPVKIDTNYPYKIYLEKKDIKLINKIIDL